MKLNRWRRNEGVEAPGLPRSFRLWAWSGGCAGFLLLAGALALPLWIWYGWRIEPRAGQIAVLIRKTGAPLPGGQILAGHPGQQGIQPEVLPEGRYFYNPYTWGWRLHPVTDVPAGRLGVKIRLFGAEPAAGEIIAGPDQRGIVPDILAPGKHRINPYAYDVLILDAIHIRPGAVGVVTSLVGRDIVGDESLPAAERNTFLVKPEFKGVLPKVLDPGTYYLNPFLFAVVEVNLQSQRFEMSGEEAPTFLTADGFLVRVEGTIEFSLEREQAAQLTHQVGDLDDIVKKVILPRARGFSRVEGSKKPAVDIIVGETRQEFQNNLEAHLHATCAAWGIQVHSVLIRSILPPAEITRVIQDRELAVQEALKFGQQIEQAKSRAELVRQEMLAEQNRRKVEAETDRLRAEIGARQALAVRVTAAEKDLEVAHIDSETATVRIVAQLTEAGAQQEVIRKANEAEAGVLGDRARALGGGLGLARYELYRRLAPRLQTLLTNDGQEGFGLALPPARRAATQEDTP